MHPAPQPDLIIPAAAVALWRPAAERELLLVQRGSLNRRGRPMSFADAWVLPGGKVDPDDERDDRPFARAATRELAEETGVGVPIDHMRFLWQLTSEIPGRTYLTRYFAVPAPEGSTPRVDGAELVDLRWMTPRAALAAFESGRMDLPPATVTTLRRLEHGWRPDRRRRPQLDRARRPGRCRLSDLAAATDEAFVLPNGRHDPEIQDLVEHHDLARPGVLFASRRPRRPDDEAQAEADRRDRLRAAIEQGASGVVVDEPLDTPPTTPQVIVPDVPAALGHLASLVHQHPSDALDVVFVTGTDGKTTTCYFAAAALRRALGRGVGLLTTVENVIGGEHRPAVLTTGEAPDIQRDLAAMVRRNDVAAVVEASSIALDHHRLAGASGDVAVFTNLSPEHQDHHETMEAYFDAKSALFQPAHARHAVVAVDDHWGQRLASLIRAERQLELTTVSTRSADADAIVVDCQCTADGAHVRARVHGTEVDVEVRLPGDHNIANALVAVAAAVATGADPRLAARGIGDVTKVPGRMDRIPNDAGVVAVVDYAHTPAALRAVLAACRDLVGPGGRIILVAGCGGDRDKPKRGEMGVVASQGADLLFATSDNPRKEDRDVILDEMLRSTTPHPDRVIREPDREQAIRRAAAAARPGDVVLVAGKGHEQYQEVDGVKRPFDDHVLLAAALGGQWSPATSIERQSSQG